MENSTFFTVRTLQKAFLYDAIRNTLFRTKPFMADNTKACSNFMSAVIDYVVKHDNHGFYPTFRKVWSKFNDEGIKSGSDLVQVMLNNKDLLTKAGYKMDHIKVKRTVETEYKSFGRNSHVGMDETRTLAVRSKFGGYDVKFYEFNGAIRDCKQLNDIKLDYHYSTGCKYYEVRPILLSTWLTLSPEQQYATCHTEVIGEED